MSGIFSKSRVVAPSLARCATGATKPSILSRSRATWHAKPGAGCLRRDSNAFMNTAAFASNATATLPPNITWLSFAPPLRHFHTLLFKHFKTQLDFIPNTVLTYAQARPYRFKIQQKGV